MTALRSTLTAVWALARKDLRLLARDRAALFLTFAWPLLLATFFGALGPGFGALTADGAHASGSAMTVLVVDESSGPDGRDLLRHLALHPRVELEADSLGSARERVRAGDRPAYVHLGPDFSLERAPLVLDIGVDPRRHSEAEMLTQALELAAHRARLSEDFETTIQVRRDPLAGPGSAGSTAAVAPPSPYAVTFPQGIIWAVLACAATFATSLVQERHQGTLLRLAVAPLPRWQLLAGKALACLLAIFAVSLPLVAVAVAVFGVRPQSWGLLGLAVFCTGLGFVGVMTLLAALGRKTASAAGLSWAVLMAMAILGGGMLPLFMMPEAVQQVANASPVAWALLAMEGAVWRGFGLAQVLPWCGALVGLGALGLLVGARTVRDL